MGLPELNRRMRLQGFASGVSEQLQTQSEAVFADGTGTLLGAIRNIARDNQETEDFATALVDLLEHIEKNYPIPTD